MTLVGVRLRDDSVGPDPPPELVTVRMAGATTPRYVALRSTAVLLVTDELVTVNEAEVAPEEIVTLEGTDATALLALDRETTAPPLGAALFKTTVPVDSVPPLTVMGLSWKAEMFAPVVAGSGFMVKPAKAKPQLHSAEMLIAVWEPTSEVSMENVALVEPAGTVTVGGTMTEVIPAPSETTTPPVGAGPVRVTVPVVLFPPTIVLGFSVRADGVTNVPVWLSTMVVDWV